jgi:hypothetical protein
MVGIEMRGEADGGILDSVVDPAPLLWTVMRTVTVTGEEGRKDDGSVGSFEVL